MEGTLQSEGPWTMLAPTDAVLDDAGFNVRGVGDNQGMQAYINISIRVHPVHIHPSVHLTLPSSAPRIHTPQQTNTNTS